MRYKKNLKPLTRNKNIKEQTKRYFFIISKLSFCILNYIFGRRIIYIILKNLLQAWCNSIVKNGNNLIALFPESNQKGYIKYIPKYDFLILIDLNDLGIGLQIAETGEWETNVLIAMKNICKPQKIFLDIGSNIGYYSIYASKVLKQNQIIAFEPDKNNYFMLTKNIEINQLKNIKTYNVALGDENKELFLSNLGVKNNSGTRVVSNDKHNLEKYIHGPIPFYERIQSKKLDDLLEISHVDYIKLDIEGYEPYALRGMEETIKRDKPIFFVEFAPSNLHDIGNSSGEKFLSFFIKYDYQIYLIEITGDLTVSHHIFLVSRKKILHKLKNL